jgi:hypothetical protein
MTEFKAGDRVRVLSSGSIPTPYAGRTGTVVKIVRNASGEPLCYRVCLDGHASRGFPFWPGELEVETSATP